MSHSQRILLTYSLRPTPNVPVMVLNTTRSLHVPEETDAVSRNTAIARSVHSKPDGMRMRTFYTRLTSTVLVTIMPKCYDRLFIYYDKNTMIKS